MFQILPRLILLGLLMNASEKSPAAVEPVRSHDTCPNLPKVYEDSRTPSNERPLSWLTDRELLVLIDHMERNEGCLLWVVRKRDIDHFHFQWDTIRRLK